MLSKVEAAYKILKAAKKPLNTHEIIEKALKRGLVSTAGKTPADTLRVDIYQENKRREKRKLIKDLMKSVVALLALSNGINRLQ